MGQSTQTNLGRITHKSFGKNNPFEVVFNGLKGKIPLASRSFFYHFKNVTLVSLQKNQVIYGELYKSRLSSEHEVLDKDTLNYDYEYLDELFTKNRFVIFTDLSIVFTSNSKFKDDDFIKCFEDLYNANTEDLFSHIKIHYQKEDADIFKKIQSFARLTEVELVKIRKSNPIPKPTFKRIEMFLEKEKTDELTAKFVSEKNEGLSRDYESHIMSGISIADSGYGDSIIVGQKKDGEFEKIKLSDQAIRKRLIDIHSMDTKAFVSKIFAEFKRYIHSEEDLTND